MKDVKRVSRSAAEGPARALGRLGFTPNALTIIGSLLTASVGLLAAQGWFLAAGICLWLFSDVLSRAFDSWFVPFLGFFLLPWTTLAYAAFWDWGPGREVTGFEWFFVGLAFVIDIGSYVQTRR